MSYPKYRAAGIIVGGDWDALTRTVLNYGKATAVVGFNSNLTNRENYFLCDGVADEVQWQQAVDYLDGVQTGLLFAERGLYSFNDTLTVHIPIYIKGVGPGWHGVARPTCINTAAGLAGKDVIEYVAGARQHFGGISDLTIYNTTGQNAIFIDSFADFVMRNVYINHSGLNCVYVEGDSFDLWHLIFDNCWLENATGAGLRFDCADHDFTKIQIINNRFYANDLGVIFQRAVASGGLVRNIFIRNNMFLQMGKTAIQLWKVCNNISITDNNCRDNGQDAANTYVTIRIGDGDAPADKCEWIKIVGNIINGNAQPKYGIGLEDSTDRVLVANNMIRGCVTATYNAEGTVTNVEKAHNVEV